jgi:hypothetical protein
VSSTRIPQDVQRRVHQQAGERCGYCLSQQRYVLGRLEIDHLIPRSQGGSDREENLWLACRLCNSAKRDQTHGIDLLTGEIVPLFNPRTQTWAEHFSWSKDGARIEGRTPCGRATVIALQLNNLIAVMVRQAWIAAGWHPPLDEA